VLANEQARTLFNLNPRDLGRPLQDLEISYRPLELRSRIDQVSTNRRAVILKEVEWSITEQETRYFDVQVIPLLNHNSDELLGVKIVFTDVTRFKQLQHSKLEAGRLELRLEEFNLAELVTATTEELRCLAEQKHLTLYVYISLSNPNIINDSDRVRQILVNLLSNAIKFTEIGGAIGY
jgi:two-component system CheB/CheR fusion protein